MPGFSESRNHGSVQIVKGKSNMENFKRFLFSGEDYEPTFRDIMYFIALVLLLAISAIQI